MFHMKKEFVISLADLRHISVECPHCKASLTIDMQHPSEFAAKYSVFVPKECPACRVQYDSAIQPSVSSFVNAYKGVMTIAGRITFRAEAENEVLTTLPSGRASDGKD